MTDIHSRSFTFHLLAQPCLCGLHNAQLEPLLRLYCLRILFAPITFRAFPVFFVTVSFWISLEYINLAADEKYGVRASPTSSN